MAMSQHDRSCLPLLLSARMRVWWLLYQARRNPRRVIVTVIVVAVVLAGPVAAAFSGPAPGCSFRPAATPGRAHWVCVREGRAS